MDYLYRTDTIMIKKSDPLFQIIDNLSFLAKNIYNSALYIERQSIIKNGKVINYSNLNSLHKQLYPQDYTSLPIQTTQQILMLAARNCHSFSKATNEYFFNPSKFYSKPKLPKYKHKTTGRHIIPFTNQQVKYRDGYLYFPTKSNIPPIKTRLDLSQEHLDLQQIRIVPCSNSYKIEIIYTKGINLPPKQNIISGLDLGLDNFATISIYNYNTNPLIINGKGLKSYNKFFNKQLASLKSQAMKRNNLHTTKKIQSLHRNRLNYFKDFYHKASKHIVNYLVENKVGYIVIGKNKNWKQNSPLSKEVNQTFIQIGHSQFIDILTYKLLEQNISVYISEESYTSGTSYLDKEEPTKENYNKSRRIHRGLFRSNQGYLINADVNAAFQIIKKVKEFKVTNYPPPLIPYILQPKKINIA